MNKCDCYGLVVFSRGSLPLDAGDVRVERPLPLFIENRNPCHFFFFFFSHQHAQSMGKFHSKRVREPYCDTGNIGKLSSQKTAIMPPCNNLQKKVSVNGYGLCGSSITYS